MGLELQTKGTKFQQYFEADFVKAVTEAAAVATTDWE